jgi:hypothetical protein
MDEWISIAVLSAPSNRGDVKSTMWIAHGISFLGGLPLLFCLDWWGLLSGTGCVIPQLFVAEEN